MGAGINKRGKRYKTPLSITHTRKHNAIVKYLIEHGVHTWKRFSKQNELKYM